MKELYIKKLKGNSQVSLSEAEQILENQTNTNSIATINWKEFEYLPEIQFRIGHTGDEIWLKYYVREHHLRANETKINGEVYKDSCVEFFISHDNENYYNFEFSCIGTVHLAWGSGRHQRKFVDPALIEKIRIESSLGRQPFEKKSGNFNWQMMIRIPVDCFAYSHLDSFNNLHASANFYKCGDETSVPHYVTWNRIGTKQPDYHQPDYFGKIHFE